jgi:hypothetical protein
MEGRAQMYSLVHTGPAGLQRIVGWFTTREAAYQVRDIHADQARLSVYTVTVHHTAEAWAHSCLQELVARARATLDVPAGTTPTLEELTALAAVLDDDDDDDAVVVT